VAKTYFIPGEATRFLIERTRELGLLPIVDRRVGAGTLYKAGLLPWGEETAKDILGGSPKYNVSDSNAEFLKQKFRITPEEWISITKVIEDESRILEEHPWLLKFLESFSSGGLRANTTLLPRGLKDVGIADFCVPARVVTESEWQSLPADSRQPEATDDPAAQLAISRRVAGVLLNTWLARERGHTVLFGEPGEGKTTALWLFVASECARWRSAVSSGEPLPPGLRLPLVLPLRSIQEVETKGLLGLAIQSTLQFAETSSLERSRVSAWIEVQARLERVMLILDGFDELNPALYPWLRREISRAKGHGVLLTTRYHADPYQVLQGFQTLRMVPLRWWIIDEYIHRYFETAGGREGCANELRSELRATPSLRHLAQSPLLLAALCAAKDTDAREVGARSRADVLGRALRVLLARGDKRRGHLQPRTVRDEAKVQVLSRVAWRYFALGPLPMPAVPLALLLDAERTSIANATPETGEDLLRELVEDGILVRQGEGPYSFLLRRFHEYCLSLHIAKQSKALPGPESKALFLSRSEAWNRAGEWPDFRPMNHPAWREVLPLAAGVMEDDASLVQAAEGDWRLREDLTDSRLRLLAEVLGEFLAGNRDRPGTTAALQELTAEVTEAVLDRVAEEPIITSLVVSWRRTLTALSPDDSTRRLAERLRANPSHNRASAYAMALGEVGTPEASEHLRMLLEAKNSTETFKANVAVALGLVGDEEARESLLKCLSTRPQHYILLGVINGLSLVADGKARAAVAGTLSSESAKAEATHEALRHCEILFGPEIEEALVKLVETMAKDRSGDAARSLPETQADLVQDCTAVLGRIGRPATAKRLRDLLEPRFPVRLKRTLYQAIAEIGDAADREFLRKRLDERGESEFAALALLSVGDEAVLDALLGVIPKHPSEDVRESAASIAGMLHGESVLKFLTTCLQRDKSELVRRRAAISLGQHGGPKAQDALRRALAESRDETVLLQCARSLAFQGYASAEEFLIRMALDDSQPPTTRFVAVAALGELPSERARETLRSGADSADTQSEYRRRCLDGIAALQRRSGWRALRRRGWESP